MNNLILILVVVGLWAPHALAEEEYYTWVDENGITNYAERNPEGIDATYVSRNRAFGQRAPTGRPGSTPGQSTEMQQTPVTSSTDPDALVDEQAAILAAEVAEIKRKNCEIGKNNLAQIKAFSRLRVEDENGQSRILTDDEKEERAERARQTIRDNCSG